MVRYGKFSYQDLDNMDYITFQFFTKRLDEDIKEENKKVGQASDEAKSKPVRSPRGKHR